MYALYVQLSTENGSCSIFAPRNTDPHILFGAEGFSGESPSHHSVAPARNEVQAPVYRTASHAELIPGAEKPMSEESLRDPVKRGFYLATIAHCTVPYRRV